MIRPKSFSPSLALLVTCGCADRFTGVAMKSAEALGSSSLLDDGLAVRVD